MCKKKYYNIIKNISQYYYGTKKVYCTKKHAITMVRPKNVVLPTNHPYHLQNKQQQKKHDIATLISQKKNNYFVLPWHYAYNIVFTWYIHKKWH